MIASSLFKGCQVKKVLVAGGAGFLGSHLCERLLRKNCYVICVDNLYSSTKKNILPFLDNKNFEFILHDIIQPIFFEIDEIYNLACAGSPEQYQRDPKQTLKTSFLGALNLLGLAKRKKASYFFSSSSEVYGDAEVSPQNESYWGKVNPIGKRACYDEGKRIAECLAFEYKNSANISIKIGRLFNTFGPNMHIQDGRVISNFICQALANKPITIYGNGSQTRSFCYVQDTILGIEKLMESDNHISGPINLGNNNEITVKTLAEIIIKMTNSKSDLKFCDLPEDDPKIRRPDLTLAKTVLDYSPTFTLENGLKETIKYFSNELESSL